MMRLWHQSLIPYLPDHQLLGQHRECCALRGLGWGRPHFTVNYVFEYPRYILVAYHYHVISEMVKRGFTVDKKWFEPSYRGKNCPKDTLSLENLADFVRWISLWDLPLYSEHDLNYIDECLRNLASKGILLNLEGSV